MVNTLLFYIYYRVIDIELILLYSLIPELIVSLTLMRRITFRSGTIKMANLKELAQALRSEFKGPVTSVELCKILIFIENYARKETQREKLNRTP